MDKVGLGAITLGLAVWGISCLATAADDDNTGNLRYTGSGPHYLTSGKLGIGTTEPAEVLDVAGNVRLGQGAIRPTTLATDILESDATIPVVSTEGYPISGTLLIDSEAMPYLGKTPTAFMGVKRGVLGSFIAKHNVRAIVDNYLLTVQRTAALSPAMVVTGQGFVGVGTRTPISTLQVKGGYFQLPKRAWGDPPATDCDQREEVGRMILEDSSRDRLWVCRGGHGWRYLSLDK